MYIRVNHAVMYRSVANSGVVQCNKYRQDVKLETERDLPWTNALLECRELMISGDRRTCSMPISKKILPDRQNLTGLSLSACHVVDWKEPSFVLNDLFYVSSRTSVLDHDFAMMLCCRSYDITLCFICVEPARLTNPFRSLLTCRLQHSLQRIMRV